MRIIVLGGLGIQGKAALMDLAKTETVKEVVCADLAPDRMKEMDGMPGRDKVRFQKLDASSKKDLASVLSQGFDAAVDLLPLPFMAGAFEAAIDTQTPLVSTNYTHTVRHLADRAREKGVTIMPECGLDPGIDLVIIGHGARQFDQLHVLNSYCGGIPEASACDNPINYKISWNWEMVLNSQMRPSVFIKNGQRVALTPELQHDNDMIHTVEFPGLGNLEAIPNGDAVFYTDLLGVTDTIRETGRYSMRWPGWCEFWKPLKRLGFLNDTPVPGLPGEISPRKFLIELLGPQLQYKDDEKDLAVMINVFEGIKDGRPKRLTYRLLLERDLDSGLMAMSIGVGFTASIVAQMIARKEITKPGMLSPLVDIPYPSFMSELSLRGVLLEEETGERVNA